MTKSIQTQFPEFKNDEEIAAFMEQNSVVDLLEADLAEIVPTPHFVRKTHTVKPLLKDKRVQIAFKDERPLRRIFSSSVRTFFVIDVDLSGILLSLPESRSKENFYVPYLNISGIKILKNSQ